jgi:enterochelin esterase-like enzyme
MTMNAPAPDRLRLAVNPVKAVVVPLAFRALRKIGPALFLAVLAFALAAGLFGPAEAAGGRISAFTYHSAALDKDQTAQVYVPGTGQPEEGWPVLYLLHGLDGKATDWAELGRIRSTLDDLIETKRIKPLVVVMPEGANSWYVDSAAIGGPGDYATAIGRDLPAAIEAGFPVARDRMHRAIAGVSMGGYGALRLALLAPERYGVVAALSPAIWQNIPVVDPESAAMRHDHAPLVSYFQTVDPDTVTVGIDLPPDGRHFGAAFGTPFDPKRFDAANVFTLLRQAVAVRKALPPIFLTVGDDDSHLLWRGSIAFFETMQMDKRSIEFRVTDGDHCWDLWRKSIVDALLFMDDSMSKVAQR